jgi:hypothetical protein
MRRPDLGKQIGYNDLLLETGDRMKLARKNLISPGVIPAAGLYFACFYTPAAPRRWIASFLATRPRCPQLG